MPHTGGMHVFMNKRTYNPWLTLAFVGVLVVILVFPGAIRSSANGLLQTGDPQPGVPEVVVTPADSVPAAELQPQAAAGPYTVRLPLIFMNYLPPPAVPVLNAIANADGDGNYAVAWSAAAGATSYTLEEDDNVDFASPTAQYNGAGTSWNANCKAVGAYFYRVRASNTGGLSEWSNVASTAVQPPVLSVRLGYSLAGGSFNQYPEAASLKAGWYVDWNVQQTPQCPNGTEYVQMVRLHQNLTSASTGVPCPFFSADAWDRSKCPYASPPSYSFWPSADVIAQAARANPGSLWLIGNEMDRRDWPVVGDGRPGRDAARALCHGLS